MKEYAVKITSAPVRWDEIEKAYINEYAWGGEYRPLSFGQAAFVPGDGFYIKLTSYEKDPKTEFHNNMDPVYRDSCLEFFAEYKKGGYINCEVNSAGAILSAYGENRENRTPLDRVAGRFPDATAEKDGEKWSVQIKVGLDIIEKVYGAAGFGEGDAIRGNFYKCGDGCAQPHYGAFSAVGTAKPDFHRPEFFVSMKLVK